MARSGMTEQQGRVLGGRYRLTAHLGTGSSAQVFLADDVTLRRRVAVKVLHPALADDESFLRRFRAEARAAAALSHPNLMAVFDWGEDDGPYLVLEFLGGGSLRALLDTGARLSLAQAVAVGLETTRALDAAHRRGFVHRDIKPANLLFGDDGRLRIADFGLARALSEAAWTEPGDGLVGTARYAAPEQATSPRIDGKADVYSLGLVLIEAVTGRVPLTADTALGTLMRRVDAPVPVPDELGPLVPLLARVGQVDPATRPDAAELARALAALERSLDRPQPLALAGALGTSSPHADPTLIPGSVLGTSPVASSTASSTASSAASPVLSPVEAPDGAERPGGPDDPVADGGALPGRADNRDGSGAEAVAVGAPRTPLFDDLAVDGPEAPGEHAPAPPDHAGEPARAPAAHPVVGSAAVGRGGRSRRRTGLVVLLVLVAVAAVAAAVWFMARGTDGGSDVRSAEVPALQNESRADAEALLAAAAAAVDAASADDAGDGDDPQEPFAWDVAVRQEPSEAVEAGFVIRQLPDAGTELDEGGTVRYWVSLGSPLRVVPDLVNRTEEEVAVDLPAAELSVGRTTTAPDEVVEPGRVLTWRVGDVDRPPRAPKGTEVDVVVSSGPAPRTVPPLVDEPVDQARTELEAMGLEVSTSEDFSRTVPAGSVISSDPADGASVPRGATVSLVVSKGPNLVQVPDVSGLSEQEAIAALQARGLVAGTSTGSAGGRVFDSDPAAGASVEPGTVVDLFRRR